MTSARTIREVVFEGGHFERGVQRGRRLRGTLVLPDLSALPPRFVQECRDAAGALHPPALEEFEGLVCGGGFDRDRMTAYYFARLESRLGGCTMFAAAPQCRSEGSGPVVGRNYDWAVEDLRWCELHRYRPTEGLRRIGYTHHWAGCPDVLNERGLYVAIASLPGTSGGPQPPGVQWSILVEMMSERCGTVAEALGVCGRVRHLRPMSYLIADASGDAAIVEATPWEVRVRRPRDGFVVAANVAQGGELLATHTVRSVGYALPEPAGPGREADVRVAGRAERRVARATRLLRQEMPAVSEESARRILTDHRAPICTGDHRRADGAPWATIWSGICTPADGRFQIAPGLPCRHDYRTFTFADA
ncbi:MAG: hypothetical protein KAX44_07050 [Candidatus Brocadiae bacterium]|nr:hypothetical protein [Candidatus Brocadiia bacterium]